MTETEDRAGKFDELVAATIRTAVDEWRIQNDPADLHGMGMPEYIRRALADAGVLASSEWERLSAEVERLAGELTGLRRSHRDAHERHRTALIEALGPYATTPSMELISHIVDDVTRLATEAKELRADKEIRQGALNDVLGRDRAADYYGAVEDVAHLVRAHRQLIAEAERLRLERADVRGLIRSVGEEPLPADVPTQQAVSWLVDEYKKLLEQDEELLGEQDETLLEALLRNGARDLLKQVNAQGQRIKVLQAALDRRHEIQGARPRVRPPFPCEARQWMDEGARVECFSGKDPADVIHEGWIIGMTEAPTVRVQKDDGRIVSWVLGITRRQAPMEAGTSRWNPGDIALDHTNFVWQRHEYGWRTVPRDRGVQYEDEQLESLAGPLVRIAAVPVEVDELGAVPADVAERLRAEVAESTSLPQRTPRLRECVERWPASETDTYDPRCCRFPKSCSATVYDAATVKPEDLEVPRG